MKLSKSLHTPPATDIGTGLKWQPAGVNNIAGVTNSTFTPSTPRLGTNSRNVIPRIENGEWLVARQDSWSSLDSSPVEQLLEQTPSPLEFRQVTDAAHKTQSRSRLKDFIHNLFHPKRFWARRKAAKLDHIVQRPVEPSPAKSNPASQRVDNLNAATLPTEEPQSRPRPNTAIRDMLEAEENIKGMLAAPTAIMIGGRYEALNRELQSAFSQFIAVGDVLKDSENAEEPNELSRYLATTVPYYTTLTNDLGTLLKTKIPTEILLDTKMTESWRTVLAGFADFANTFRKAIEPCKLLIEEIQAARHPGEFLSDSVPDWSTRFDEMNITALNNAPLWLKARLWAYLSAEKQRLQAIDRSVDMHF